LELKFQIEPLPTDRLGKKARGINHIKGAAAKAFDTFETGRKRIPDRFYLTSRFGGNRFVHFLYF
jgi:hypothetical protein